MTHSYVQYDTTHPCVYCDMTQFMWMRHDTSVCETQLLHTCDMTFARATWPMSDMTHHVTHMDVHTCEMMWCHVTRMNASCIESSDMPHYTHATLHTCLTAHLTPCHTMYQCLTIGCVTSHVWTRRVTNRVTLHTWHHVTLHTCHTTHMLHYTHVTLHTRHTTHMPHDTHATLHMPHYTHATWNHVTLHTCHTAHMPHETMSHYTHATQHRWRHITPWNHVKHLDAISNICMCHITRMNTSCHAHHSWVSVCTSRLPPIFVFFATHFFFFATHFRDLFVWLLRKRVFGTYSYRRTPPQKIIEDLYMYF